MTDEVRNRKNMWMYEMSNKCIKCGRYGHVAANCNVMSLNPLKCNLLHSEPNRFRPHTTDRKTERYKRGRRNGRISGRRRKRYKI